LCLVSVTVLDVSAPTEDKIYDAKDSFYEEFKHVFDKFHKYHMKILLGDFIAEVGKENNSKLAVGNESLHEINNDNGIRVVNFATSNNLTVKRRCSHIAAFMNIFQSLQMLKPIIITNIFW
jgi:hypothetical protein